MYLHYQVRLYQKAHNYMFYLKKQKKQKQKGHNNNSRAGRQLHKDPV